MQYKTEASSSSRFLLQLKVYILPGKTFIFKHLAFVFLRVLVLLSGSRSAGVHPNFSG